MNIIKKIKAFYQRHKTTMNSVSPEDAIVIAQSHQGRLTAGQLARNSSLNYLQASLKLHCLSQKGYFRTALTDAGEVYLLKQGKEAGSLSHFSKKHLHLTDAEVLSAAIEHSGSLTPTRLCVATGSSIDVAQKKLEELHLKGVFELEVTNSGVILYVLNETDWREDSSTKKVG
ncbi:hypothetical protein [Microscilla marina]|uniref:Uncharacterized protein n=1 Tax=Microscilla marina ATCC 23134 TaxID=313606 RepID=A1ZGL0_MICM2|nr:hypothetical protein [Microscilla marina]EAY30627.1 hypothetical protein M23134_03265 [Microscilla marina ATCC 23134]